MDEVEKKCREILGTTTEYIVDMIADMNVAGPVGTDYIRRIAEECVSGIVDDMIDTADREEWDSDDVRLAFGRVLWKKLGIIV